MRRLTAPIKITAALLAALPGLAHAAEPACLTPAEFTSLATFALPSVITGTAQRCSTTLGANAYLRRNGAQLASSYAANRASVWPAAKAAFVKVSASSNADTAKLISGMPDTSLQQMADAAISGIVAQRVPLERCDTIDSVARLLSPLPPQNTAELLAVAVGLGTKAGERKVGPINICKA